MDLRRHVAEIVKDRLSPVPRIVLACSGGPDSVVLADIAMALAADGMLAAVTLVYVDHQLREDSALDGDRVAALASRGGARFIARTVTVDASRASLEEAARLARYAALDQVTGEVGADWIWLAHTASDQAETVLMRIIRGTGVVGLAGMATVRGRYVRPLLEVPRSEVEAYRRHRDLDAADDPMNADERFTRVRMRRGLLPALSEENPRIEDALCRLAASARHARDLIESGAEALSLSASELSAAPPAVAIEALAAAARDAGLAPLEARHLSSVLELCGRDRAGSVGLDLPGGRVVREYDSLRFTASSDASPAEGQISVVGDYLVRSWQPGDRMRPARLKGRSRKLSDLYIDERIPRDRRGTARVVVRPDDGEIVWAEHIGAAYGAHVEVSLTPSMRVATNKKLTGT